MYIEDVRLKRRGSIFLIFNHKYKTIFLEKKKAFVYRTSILRVLIYRVSRNYRTTSRRQVKRIKLNEKVLCK